MVDPRTGQANSKISPEVLVVPEIKEVVKGHSKYIFKIPR